LVSRLTSRRKRTEVFSNQQIFVPRKGKAEKRKLIGGHYLAFLPVDLELEAPVEETGHTRHEPLASPLAADEDHHVVSIAGEQVN
jgi:hypothetical protein